MGLFLGGDRELEVPEAQYNHDIFDDQVTDAPDGSLPAVTHWYHLDLPATPRGTRP